MTKPISLGAGGAEGDTYTRWLRFRRRELAASFADQEMEWGVRLSPRRNLRQL